jgi:hypothetical protein
MPSNIIMIKTTYPSYRKWGCMPAKPYINRESHFVSHPECLSASLEILLEKDSGFSRPSFSIEYSIKEVENIDEMIDRTFEVHPDGTASFSAWHTWDTTLLFGMGKGHNISEAGIISRKRRSRYGICFHELVVNLEEYGRWLLNPTHSGRYIPDSEGQRVINKVERLVRLAIDRQCVEA